MHDIWVLYYKTIKKWVIRVLLKQANDNRWVFKTSNFDHLIPWVSQKKQFSHQVWKKNKDQPGNIGHNWFAMDGARVVAGSHNPPSCELADLLGGVC